MKILLAGATGVVGVQLLPRLVAAGHEVIGTTRREEKFAQIETLGVQARQLNAFDRQQVFDLIQSEQPDVLIHQLTDLASQDYATNSRLRVEGTRNLVDAALAASVSRMISQSIAWVSAAGEGLVDETDELDLGAPEPRLEMVQSVQTLEEATLQLLEAVVLRYGILYGPGTWYGRGGFIFERIKSGQLAATDAITSFVHVSDAANAAVEALAWPSGIYNIVDDHPAPGSEWAPWLANLLGAPEAAFKPEVEAWQRGASNRKARQAGWHPEYPDWRQGFKDEVSRQHP